MSSGSSGNGRLWLPIAFLVAVLLTIFALSAQPHSSQFTERIFGQHNAIARKAAHFTEFAVAFFAVYWGLRAVMRRTLWLVPAILSLVLCLGYAGLDEWHQSFVPGRSPSMHDVHVDAMGVATGFALLCLFRALLFIVRCVVGLWRR